MTATVKKSHPVKANKKGGSKVLRWLGEIGKALMFPIAALPIAAILLRIGAEIPNGAGYSTFATFTQKMIITGGSVVFDNLAILFAIGIAFGLTKDNRGEAAFAGFVAMMLLVGLLSTSGVNLTNAFYGKVALPYAQFNDAGQTLDQAQRQYDALRASTLANYGSLGTSWKPFEFHVATGFVGIFGSKFNDIMGMNVLNGILVGILVSVIYNHTRNSELPKVLGFFAGRRLVPVLAIFAVLIGGILWALIFPWIGWLIYLVSDGLSRATGNRWANAGIMGAYGFLNRLLIPFGLHHIPNNLFWFQLGSQVQPGGAVINGDIFIFLSGAAKDNHAGTFQSGFFPVMMFGLPAMVFAFFMTADDKDQRRRVMALFGSAALVSFLTGITEPIEFAFLFVSPLLFGIHALLTGLFGFIVGLFGIQIGFGFSAGLFDYLISLPKSFEIIRVNYSGVDAVFRNPLWLILIGAVTAVTYYFVTYGMIKKLNLNTPGRGSNRIMESADEVEEEIHSANSLSRASKLIVKGFGGWDNIVDYTNCSTRLRYTLKDGSKVDENLLKQGGVIGVKRMSDTYVHAIVGTHVESVNNEIKSHVGESLE